MSIPKETSAPVAKSASAKKMLMGDLMQTVGILPFLILIVAVFGFIAPNFFTESNLLNITRQASINIVLAAGMTFIILTGGIDLSVGSILGTTAVAAMVATNGLVPVEIKMAQTAPPSGKLPSTVRSGKRSNRKEIKTPSATRLKIRPISTAPSREKKDMGQQQWGGENKAGASNGSCGSGGAGAALTG